MPDRMLRYLTDIRLNYPNQHVYQYLLYIGKQPLSMASGINSEQLQYYYNMLDMHDMDYQFFMRQPSSNSHYDNSQEIPPLLQLPQIHRL
jgi:hypothetical protein